MQTVTPELLAQHPLPDHRDDTDKHERGRVLVIAGSVEIPGAALLAGLGALRAGAGVLQIATCESLAAAIGVAMPEAKVIRCRETFGGGIDPSESARLIEQASHCNAVLIGPGMANDEAVAELTLALLSKVRGPQFVLDAAAFTCMRQHHDALKAQAGRVTVTPHAGEMATFLGTSRAQVDEDPSAAAQTFASQTGSTVILKGARTIIVCPSDPRGSSDAPSPLDEWLCDHGCIGLGTSGSGDTLAGILTGLLARGTAPGPAAIWSAYLHAEAGQRLTKRMGPVGFLAREIPAEIPRIMDDLRSEPRRPIGFVARPPL